TPAWSKSITGTWRRALSSMRFTPARPALPARSSPPSCRCRRGEGDPANAWPSGRRRQEGRSAPGPLRTSFHPLHAHWPAAASQPYEPHRERGLHLPSCARKAIAAENVKIEYRFADGHYDRLPALASDLVSRQVNVLVALGVSGFAAKTSTADIPIVTITG